MENRVIKTIANAAATAAKTAQRAATRNPAMKPTPQKFRKGKSSDKVGLGGFPSIRNMQRNLNRGLWSPPEVTDKMRARHDWFYRPKAAKS
jgi:hypothetical protein